MSPRRRHTPTRLLALLDGLVHAPIAVVSGPAGYGQDTLVDDWLSSHPSWPRVDVTRPESLAELQKASDDHPDALAIGVLDTTATTDPATTAALARLAESNQRVRALFVGLTRPDVPLGSLAARGRLVDIDAAELALTVDEVRETLRPTNPQLDDAVVNHVMASTLGWPAMVQVFSRRELTWDQSAKITRLADDYVEQEVLAGLDPDDLALLANLALLPELEPQAAAWMTGRGDATAQLARLQSHGIPLHWDDANTIRLNPMLRTYLTRRLARQDPEQARVQTERAARWLRHRGRTLEALALCGQAGLTELAWMLAGEFVARNMHLPALLDRARDLVVLLPDSWEAEAVRVIALGLSAPDTMMAQLRAIDPEAMVNRQNTGRLGYAAFVLGMVRASGYPAEADTTLALRIAEAADPQEVDEIDQALVGTVVLEHGLWLLHHGEVSRARAALLSALGLGRVTMTPWVVVAALGALAMVDAEQGQATSARRLANEALVAHAEHEFSTDSVQELALLALALTHIDAGELAPARELLDQVERMRHRDAENDALRTCLTALHRVYSGEPDQASRLIGAYRDHALRSTADFHERIVAQAGFEAAMASHDTDRARQEVQRFVDTAGPATGTGRAVLEARLHLALGEPQQARDLLAPLATSADLSVVTRVKDSLHILMVFGLAADELQRSEEALHAYQRAEVLAQRVGLATPHARHLRIAVTSRTDVALTEAERNVLAHLDEQRTLAATAEALFISLNTLKTHLRRIYRKLGVSGRAEAVERARMMGIRPPQ